jgi:hypothetical protein
MTTKKNIFAYPRDLCLVLTCTNSIPINRGCGKYKNILRKSIVFLDRTGVKNTISINRINPDVS